MPAAERRALVLLLGLGVLGQALRWWLAASHGAPGDVQLLAALPPRSPLPHRDSILALARPLGPDERIDVDRASAEQLARLPRVGLALAKRIVAERNARGPFGGPEALDRVPGIGPGLLAAVGPHLAFSGPPRGPSQVATELAPVRPDWPVRRAPPAHPDPGAPPESVDLNTADEAALDALPGIGPAKARALIRYRESHGPFRALQDLAKVPGFGPTALSRLQELVRFDGR